ncbi:hypothetical protein HW453_16210, partial [Treponema phagedenis]
MRRSHYFFSRSGTLRRRCVKEYLTFETIAAYKKAVQSFAQFVIKNNYTAET